MIADIIGCQSISADFYDNWRSSDDRFVRSWEERFCQALGYNRFTVEAANALLTRLGLKQSDFSKVVITV